MKPFLCFTFFTAEHVEIIPLRAGLNEENGQVPKPHVLFNGFPFEFLSAFSAFSAVNISPLKALCKFCLTLFKKNPQEPFVNLFLDAGYQAVIFRKQLANLRREAGSASPYPSRQLQNQGKTNLFFHELDLPPGFAVGNSQ